MSKGKWISDGRKRQIATDMVAGVPLSEIGTRYGIKAASITRLRREDETYKALEVELTEEAIAEAQRRLRALVGQAVGVLKEIALLDHNVTPQGAAKVLTERRRAADDLLKWATALRALGEEPVDATETLMDRMLQEQLAQLMERNRLLARNPQRETPGQPPYPDTPPPHLFRKPGEPDEEDEE